VSQVLIIKKRGVKRSKEGFVFHFIIQPCCIARMRRRVVRRGEKMREGEENKERRSYQINDMRFKKEHAHL
jgi:hypothetical protein